MEHLLIVTNGLLELENEEGEKKRQSTVEVVFRSAHSLKGAAANICAEPTRSLSQQLEQVGAQGDLDDAGDLLQELEDHTKRLRAFAASLKDT